MAARPASSSKSPRAPARASPSPPAASPPLTAPSAPRPAAVDLSYGGQNWGNFIEVDGLNTGRFLDPPEFVVFHDKGNELNIFDRIDRQLTHADSVHLNLNYSRSWFQTPNAYDNLNVQNVISGGSGANPVFGNVGNTDQRSKIDTFNIAPSYTHTIGN